MKPVVTRRRASRSRSSSSELRSPLTDEAAMRAVRRSEQLLAKLQRKQGQRLKGEASLERSFETLTGGMEPRRARSC
jgi:hypothetical protein